MSNNEIIDHDILSDLLEEQRKLLISEIGYKKWYELLEIEDSIKNNEIDEYSFSMIESIISSDEVKQIYTELNRLREIRNNKWWRERRKYFWLLGI